MAKKVLGLMLIFLYSMSISGLALNLHFCGKKLAKVQLLHQKVTSCCSEKAEKESGCCSNQAVKTKVSDSHTIGANLTLPAIFTFAVPSHLMSVKNTFSKGKKSNLWHFKAPPERISNQILLCVFRI